LLWSVFVDLEVPEGEAGVSKTRRMIAVIKL
jgi:hypothetical protein